MSPSELEEYLQQDPLPVFRLTLSSGDQLVIHDADKPVVSGLSLVLRGGRRTSRISAGSRLVSIPNIVLIEPAVLPPPRRRRHR